MAHLTEATGTDTATTPEPFATAALEYREKGWRGVFPLPAGKKSPPLRGYTGAGAKTPTDDEIERWLRDRADANIGMHLPKTVVGIDVDAYGDKTGKQTPAEAERRWGPLPPTVRSTGRTDGVSGIRLYRIPAGVKLAGIIRFTLDDGSTTGDIEIIQNHHRYLVAHPSVHPNGAVYGRLDDDCAPVEIPVVDDLPELPAGWLEGLTGAETPEPGENASEGGDQWAKTPSTNADTGIITEALSEGVPSAAVAARLAEAVAACGGTSRHDTVRDHVLALLRLGEQGEAGVHCRRPGGGAELPGHSDGSQRRERADRSRRAAVVPGHSPQCRQRAGRRAARRDGIHVSQVRPAGIAEILGSVVLQCGFR